MEKDPTSSVDPFLVEALLNPRHRLTVLRMELDIQSFMHDPNQQCFEFPHYPTSYLRLAAHRAAQHYGLQTVVHDSSLDGSGNRIIAIRTAECAIPSVRLSDIPAIQSDDDKAGQIKIVLKPRSIKSPGEEANRTGVKRSQVRSVEERTEEYERARARIFSSASSDSEDVIPQSSAEKNIPASREESELCRTPLADAEKAIETRDSGTSSRVAILKDREKDRSDPDYDRSYGRYFRNIIPAGQNFRRAPSTWQKIQHPFGQYDAGFSLGHTAGFQASINCIPHSTTVTNSVGAVGLDQHRRESMPGYVQWPTAAMMYTHSYEPLRHGAFQAPFFQQPLIFDYSQNH
ncbi:hypothetical protein MLD38_030990 [Melastoma candidum]|uniref:Uncharacterized protein n=1 Tax=Melastoma candidum TaxID=119954 RepID=A0ACB9MPH7_9MYRT|nr:hypothetical protein MLD38_030990 [Melastoma candidum]